MPDPTTPPKRTAKEAWAALDALPMAEARIQELEIQLANAVSHEVDAINAKEKAVQQLAASEAQRVSLAAQFEAEMKKGFLARLFS